MNSQQNVIGIRLKVTRIHPSSYLRLLLIYHNRRQNTESLLSPASWQIQYSYMDYPKLSSYQMSEIIKDELEQGIEIQGETEEYAFDLL